MYNYYLFIILINSTLERQTKEQNETNKSLKVTPKKWKFSFLRREDSNFPISVN